MDSNEKICELIELLNMNNELYHSELTGLSVKINNLLDDKIRMLSDQLLSGKYTEKNEKNEEEDC